MKKIILAFLGKNKLDEVTWELGSFIPFRTKFFPLALQNWFPDYELKLALTKEAQATHKEELKQQISNIEQCILDIPSGANEQELWAAFSALIDAVPEQAELILDITHGFRSQPLFAFVAASYLQVVRKVSIKGVYYGAFDVVDKSSPLPRPVFDLLPTLTLLRWASAGNSFLSYGDGAELRNLLIDENKRIGSKTLKDFGNNLNNFTSALELLRPNETAEAATKLSQNLQDLPKDSSFQTIQQPLGLLLDSIDRRVQTFNPASFLAKALAMLRFYQETQQPTQAILAAREALVSIACVRLGVQPNSDYATRKRAETSFDTWQLSGNDSERELAALWSEVRPLRNKIGHVSAGKKPQAVHQIRNSVWEKVNKVCGVLEIAIQET
jgi:CRISPR-associated DxTHG motif protein